MKIPTKISKNNHKYIYVKEYPNFIMYKNMITGVKECFNKHDLGLIESTNIMKGFKLNPDNVKR